MNALAHCAEVLYTTGRAEETDPEALAGAPLISRWLPVVVDSGHDLEARRGLLEGAMHTGAGVPQAATGRPRRVQHRVGRSQRDRRPVHQQRGVRMMPPQRPQCRCGLRMHHLLTIASDEFETATLGRPLAAVGGLGRPEGHREAAPRRPGLLGAPRDHAWRRRLAVPVYLHRLRGPSIGRHDAGHVTTADHLAVKATAGLNHKLSWSAK